MANTKLKKDVSLLGEIEEDDKMGKLQVKDGNRLGQESINTQFYNLPDPLIPDK